MLMNDHLVAGMEANLLVSPEQASYVMSILDQFEIPFDIVSSDFQSWIDEVDSLNEINKQKWIADFESGNKRKPDFYMTNSEINAWMNDLANDYSYATVSTTGTSIEGQDFFQLDVDATIVSNPKHVYINGGIHAREWISPATMQWIIHEVITGTSDDAVRMRENYIWHIPPVINPDGYDYTWTNRMWRKNRRINSGSSCIGVDLNRNWGWGWDGPGSSTDPCSDTYRGASADSEPEVRAVEDQLMAIGGENIVLYMDVHSYSQFWLVPWGGTTEKPDDYAELKAGGDAAAAAIRSVNNLSFLVGTPPDILYVASGGSFDWAKGHAGVKYTYAPELRPASAGAGGFVIPPENIDPSGNEIFAGVVANIDFAASNP
ncbi:hypothetical protein CAPTEDRAFT_21335 [Capitella teleta]|uniref:Peptidase M14 domain-containing protein n=1 Tax=Capitella teleta TaxID=283909 RepID=R7V7G8_CAPTE|nr:hypothetical protein CAPTEDRAFT_21335 [Capitella teleta]|eukprot:ELU14422.1 hypothetical protein CAPTEDRAFT_21335 [Capitella teleta]